MFTIDVGRRLVGISRNWLTLALLALLMSTQGLAVAQRNDRQQQFLQQQAADRARAAQDAAARAAQVQRDNAAANRARSTGSQNSSGTRYPVFNTDRLRTLPSYGGSPANSNTRPGSLSSRPTPGIATPNRPTDRVMFSNGVAKLTRPLTAAEMKRGYTGKQTADGRALVKFQGRVFAVPASRLGVQPRAVNDNSSVSSRPSSLTPQRQAAIKAGLGSILGGGGSGGSAGGGGTGAGKPGITATFNTAAVQGRIDTAKERRSRGDEEKYGLTAGSNVAAHEQYKSSLRRSMEKPLVKDAGLYKIVEELYRDGAEVGSGSTAAAVRYELATGERVSGKFHSIKARDKIVELQKWQKQNQTASPGDRAAAENLISDLKDSLGEK